MCAPAKFIYLFIYLFVYESEALVSWLVVSFQRGEKPEFQLVLLHVRKKLVQVSWMKANSSTHCGPIFLRDTTNLCYFVHNKVTYVTALSLNEKLSNKDSRDLTTTWRNTANHEPQGVLDNLVTRTFPQRGCVVDRHKCCHGSRWLSVSARIPHSKCYERSRYN